MPIPSSENPFNFFKRRGFDPSSINLEPSSINLDANYESSEERNARIEKEKTEYIARIEKEKAEYIARTEKEKVEYIARIEKEKFDNAYRRRKEAGIYILAGLLVIALAVSSIVAFSQPNFSQQEKEWSRSTLTAIVSTVFGYLFGKTSSSKQE